jgi:hypothetical protein
MSEEGKAQAESSEFVKHVKEAGKSVAKQWGSLIPKEFWQHGRAARREALLALRSLVDSAINRLEEKENPAPKAAPQRKTKVEVE